MFIPMIMQMIPTWNEKPPTLYSILESIVNFDKEDKTKIKDLAKSGRSTIFNFYYPLSNKVVKEDFECMILNHFIMRRIGFETVTAFRIQLNVKLNEIMPMYNKMFDMLDGWDIFNDGEVITRDVEDERNIISNSESSNDTINSSSNRITNNSTTSGTNVSDNRNSDTPQNRLSEVRSGEYVDNYGYKQDTSSSEDNSTNVGTSDSTNNSTSSSEDNTENKGKLKERTVRTPSDKLKLYQDFIENRQNIYTMIFKDLEDLFYQLV